MRTALEPSGSLHSGCEASAATACAGDSAERRTQMTRGPRMQLTLTSCAYCGTAVLGTAGCCARCTDRVRYAMPVFRVTSPASDLAKLCFLTIPALAALAWLLSGCAVSAIDSEEPVREPGELVERWESPGAVQEVSKR